MSTKEKILEHLSHEASSDADMAEAFHMPEASVRRSRNELVKEGVVARVAATVPAVWCITGVTQENVSCLKCAQCGARRKLLVDTHLCMPCTKGNVVRTAPVEEEPVAVVGKPKKRQVEIRDTGEARSKPDDERPVPSQYYVF